MPEQSIAFSETMKHTGIWNFRDLYNFCFLWFKEEGYNVEETLYNEKILATGKEIVIKWKVWKKVSDYFKNVIEIKWKILGMQDVEIEKNGKKLKSNSGETEFKVDGFLERDYEQRWEVNPTYKFFRGIYDKYITRETREQYEDKLTAKCVSFVGDTKAFLNLGGR
jgi:hypothetical protein